ncbi:Acyl-CoA synthetase (AMP-forming)/AMP-acid ligase II [Streptomyces sp. 3213]|uniref:class I adenylate-forming enzyme family protein n=1 Tax=Streptomyces sp. 3213.3 TaxID=1855348 RepID=UPI0008977391|nr:class I adenylate-forming enzyme family protein [Streptomyces sp. 3213.3]SEC38393.1 Acyl-CoA synthetase (AMP-forming)/AMP-acid ligase II [Streptomyces sp. 3213] [Streptomyces sp. 3213.3]
MTTQPPAALLHELLDEAAARWPDRPAVTCHDRTITYLELATASRRVMDWLSELGLRRGHRLLVSAQASVTVPVLVYAASRLGVAFSLLHEQVQGKQLEHVLDDSEPVLLVTDHVPNRATAGQCGVQAEDLTTAAARAFDTEGESEPMPTATLSVDPVCLIYTSGTTSLPKAVVSTHQQMLFAVRAIQQVLGYRPDDVVYSPLPLSFDYGLYQLFLGACSGAHVWLGRPAEVGPQLLNNLLRSRATVLPAVPAVADALARLLRRAGDRKLSLRMLTNTGAAMPQDTLTVLRASLPGLDVHLMFGLTECKRATIMPANGDLARPGSSGLALPGTEVFVVDAKGQRLPAGEVGEIVVRGPNVMAGYWRHAELNAQRYPKAEGLFPELRTGDYGRIDEEGYVYVEGRRDDVYKENGFRVSVIEVEAAARRLPAVSSAAVLAPDGSAPARLFVTVTDELSPADVLQAMREVIEEYKIPRICVVVPELPLTGNGKVDRKALAALANQVDHVHG